MCGPVLTCGPVLQVIGLLPLRELALDSHTYRQHPSMPRPQYSHLDNEGIKGLVDSICSRMRTGDRRGCFGGCLGMSSVREGGETGGVR
jgi:hypothetical protein